MKVRMPTKDELFKMDRMPLLKLLKDLHNENNELRVTIRARNITIRELRMTKKKYWEKIKKLQGEMEDIK